METTKTNESKPLSLDLAKAIESARNIPVSLNNSKASIDFKEGNHKKGRMKVTIKFGKEEGEGFLNFCRLAKPENLSQDDFVKFLFYRGVQALQQDFATKVEEFKNSNPEEFAKMKADLESSQELISGSLTVAEDSSNGNN